MTAELLKHGTKLMTKFLEGQACGERKRDSRDGGGGDQGLRLCPRVCPSVAGLRAWNR
jgi:hypothetical protein